MARRPIVTRVIKGTKVTALGMDTEAENPKTESRDYYLSGTVKDNAKALKAVKKLYDTGGYVNVAIKSIEPYDQLLGMWEEDFVAHAMPLDPATRRPAE